MASRIYIYLVAALFLLSGLTSLVYQSLWIRVLSLGVGSTSTSTSLVLAIFFLGLSLGSFIFGRYSERLKRPLLAYGLIEAFIGLYGFGLIYVLFNFHFILSSVFSGASFSTLGIFVKFLLVFVLLTPPTICMGASLPLLVKLLASGGNKIGQSLSFLYGINTLGAVAGAFLAGYIFIPDLGIIVSNHLMAALNVAILPLAYFVQKGIGPSAVVGTKGKFRRFAFADLTGVQKLILLSVFVTGFASISAEVIWSKYLSIFFGSNIFGLSLLLSIFLLGLAAGSLLLSLFINRIKSKINLYLLLLALVTLFTYLATAMLNFAPIVTNLISYYANGSLTVLSIKAIVAGSIIILPTSVLGALLPLSILLVSEKSETAAGATGFTYGLNTLGSILGSAITGLFLIPRFGSGVSLQIDLLLLSGLGVVLVFAVSKRMATKLLCSALFLSIGALSVLAGKVSFNNIIKAAYYQAAPKDLTLSKALEYFSKDAENFNLIIEGKTAVISLSQSSAEGVGWKNYYRLKTNGLNESLYDMKNLTVLPKYEALLGLLPYALTPNPQSAFIVGYGGGFTVDLMTSIDLKEVYVSELERGIIEASDYIFKNDNPILKRKNVRLEIEDARYVLTAGLEHKYDIIVSQPSHSWLTGVANLFTKEYFEIVRSNLSDEGVFSQWLNLYNMDDKVLNSILKTFYSTFPHGSVFTDLGDEEMIMIGSMRPKKFQMKRLQALFADPKMKVRLRDFSGPHALVATYTIDRETIMGFVGDAPINSDRNAFAEVSQSKIFYTNRTDFPEQHLLNYYTADLSKVVADKDIGKPNFHKGVLAALELLPGEARSHQKFYQYIKSVEKLQAGEGVSLSKLGYYKFQLEQYHSAKKYIERAVRDNLNAESLNLLLQLSTKTQDFKLANSMLARAKGFRDELTDCYELSMQSVQGRWRRADRLAERIKNRDCLGDKNKILGQYFYYRGQTDKAIELLEQVVEQDNYDLDSQELLIASYFLLGRSESAMTQVEAYKGFYEEEKSRIESLAAFYVKEGLTEDAEVLKASYWRFYY